MKVLQIVAHPNLDGIGFTHRTAEAFRRGSISAGHSVRWYNVFDPVSDAIDHKAEVLQADHICFVYPCWWEMPPAKLVHILQTVFVKGFAFDVDEFGERKTTFIKSATTMISMGQLKDLNIQNLREAMTYCGLIPRFAIFQGIGPGLPEARAQEYIELAERLGSEIY